MECGPEPDRRQLGLFTAAPADALHRTPTCFEHPRANRELALGAVLVRYELRRAQRRSIGFTVGGEGLSVAAPRWVGQAEIEAALRGKQAWILRKLAEQAQRLQQLRQSRIEWRDGVSLPFLGAPVVVRLDPGRRGALLETPAGDGTVPGPRLLRLGLPGDAAAPRIGTAVKAWLQRQARGVFEDRIAHFAPRLGVQCTRLALSSARTRWGSASASGAIRLNWRLVHFPVETIDYVVAHELAHLREMNHSPRFWAVVGSVVPDYAARREALRASQPPLIE